jgi:hypothetical protein
VMILVAVSIAIAIGEMTFFDEWLLLCVSVRVHRAIHVRWTIYNTRRLRCRCLFVGLPPPWTGFNLAAHALTLKLGRHRLA